MIKTKKSELHIQLSKEHNNQKYDTIFVLDSLLMIDIITLHRCHSANLKDNSKNTNQVLTITQSTLPCCTDEYDNKDKLFGYRRGSLKMFGVQCVQVD